MISLAKQSVMMDLAGTELTSDEATKLSHDLIGGLILFSRNFQSSAQLRSLIQDARAAAGKPILVAVDHEGGRVQRFRTDGFTHVPAMGRFEQYYQGIAQSEIKQGIAAVAWLLASECLAHDIDLSFSPVLDLERGSDVIGDRAFSASVKTATEYAGYWCQGFHKAGMACIGKHFPGHGSTKADSHIAAPIDKRSFVDISQLDMAVFTNLIKQQHLDGIMPAHVQFSEVDDAPVGYSHYWLQQVLKQQLQFNGTIFSDDLSMVGAGEHLTYPEKANKAASAGCDMLLVCNRPEGVSEILAECVIDNSRPPSPAAKLMVQNKPNLQQVTSSDTWQLAKDLIKKISRL